MDPVTIAIGALVLGGAATVANIQNQRQQRKAASRAAAEQRKQRDIANRQQALERQRELRRAIAQQRVLRASVLQNQYSAGVGGGSAGLGTSSAIGTDLSTAVGAANTQMASQFGISQSQNREAGYAMTAQYGTGWGTAATVLGSMSRLGMGAATSGLFSSKAPDLVIEGDTGGAIYSNNGIF